MSLSTLHPNVDQYSDLFEVDNDFWFVSTGTTTTSSSLTPMDIIHPNEDQYRDLFEIDQPFWFVSTGVAAPTSPGRSTTDTSLTSDTASKLLSTSRSVTDTSVTTDAVTANRAYARRPGVYADVVKSDLPSSYWRLGESAGSPTAVDETGVANAVYVGTQFPNLLNGVGIAYPSFESSVAGMSCDGGGSVAQSSAQAFSGSFSALVTAGATPGSMDFYRGSNFPQIVAVTPGQAYASSIYVRAGNVALNSYMGLQWYTSAGVFISPTSAGTITATTTTGWTRISVVGTAPAGAAWMVPVLHWTGQATGDTAYVDAAQVTATSSVPAYSDTQSIKLGQSGAVLDSDTAVLLDGQGGFVSIPQQQITGDFSLEVWSNLDAAAANQLNGNNQLFGSAGLLWLARPTGAYLSLTPNGGTAHIVQTGTAENRSQWVHWVMVKSGTTATVYRNGVAIPGMTISGLEAGYIAVDRMGGSSYYLKGLLDEGALYTYALTQTQIQQHYNQGAFGNYGDDFSATSDTASRISHPSRSTSETTVISDAVTRFAPTSRSLTETTVTGDVTTRVLRVTRTTAEATLTTDTLTRSFNVARSPSDSTATSDTTTHIAQGSRAAVDTTGTSDAVLRSQVSPRSASDTTASSDVVTRGAEIMARSSADTSSTSDALSRLVRRTRITSDTTTSSDAATRIEFTPRSVTDTSLSSEFVVFVQTGVRPASDTTLTTDSLQRVVRRTRAVSDTTTSTDTVIRSLRVSRGLTETSILSDAIRIQLGRHPKDTSLTADGAARTKFGATADTTLTTDFVSRYIIPWSVYPTSIAFADFSSSVLFADATRRATLVPEESAVEVTSYSTEVVNLNA